MPGKRAADALTRIETIHGHKIPFWLLTFSDGVTAEVPQFIRRIAPGQNSKLVPGWQIVINRKDFGQYSRFFADRPDESDRQGAAERSLNEAIRALPGVLRHVPVERRSGLQVRERKRRINSTGLAGIRTLWLFDRRTGVWNLKIDARIGGGSRSGADKRQRYHVGHEHSINEERLRRAGFEAWGWRRKKLQYLPTLYNESLAPRRGKVPSLRLDLERIFDQLREAKHRQYNQMVEYASDRAIKALSGKMRLTAWRGVPIRWRSIECPGQTLRLPECIELDETFWSMAWPCPDGSVYRASRPVSDSPLADLTRLIRDGLMAAAMITVTPEVESVHQ